jgi:hypothetical protein
LWVGTVELRVLGLIAWAGGGGITPMPAPVAR